jgi:hypothetical protein
MEAAHSCVFGRPTEKESEDVRRYRPHLLPHPGRGHRGPARAARLRGRLRPGRPGQGRHGRDRHRSGLLDIRGRGRVHRAAHGRQRAAPLRLERLLQRPVPPGPRRPRPAAGAALPDRARAALLPHLRARHQAQPAPAHRRPRDHRRGAGPPRPATPGPTPSTAAPAASSCSAWAGPTATTAPAGSPCSTTTASTSSAPGSRTAATSSSATTAGGT